MGAFVFVAATEVKDSIQPAMRSAAASGDKCVLFEGAHVNPPTKIGPAKWGSADIGSDSEHNRLSYGRLEHLHGCVLIPPLAAATATN